MEHKQKSRRGLWIHLCLTIVFITIASYLAHEVIVSTQAYKSDMVRVSQILDFQGKLLNPKAWLFKSNDGDLQKLEVAKFLEMAKQDLGQAAHMGRLFCLLSAVYLLLAFLFNRGNQRFFHRMTQSIGLVAVMSLIIGILAPMLEISAFMDDLTIPLDFEILGMSISKEFFFEGRMFFYYQNKSVVDLIHILLTERNYVVAYSIIGFSFLVPILKLGTTMALVTFLPLASKSWPAKMVGSIGKWSMADVFVAASFLSYLGFSNMNTGVQTESRTLIGLYFFFAYVILSIISGYFCHAALVTKKPPVKPHN